MVDISRLRCCAVLAGSHRFLDEAVTCRHQQKQNIVAVRFCSDSLKEITPGRATSYRSVKHRSASEKVPNRMGGSLLGRCLRKLDQ